MKTVTKMLGIIAVAAVIVFSMAGCGDSQQPRSSVEASYAGGTLMASGEQVWERTGEYTISDLYVKSDITSGVKIVTSNGTEVATGDIKGGYLNFSVDDLEDDALIGWNELKEIFNEWKDVIIDEPSTNGTTVTVSTDEGAKLNREKLYGNTSILGLESVIYIYVNKDCKITGEINEDGDEQITTVVLNLNLRKGWNLLFRRDIDNLNGKKAVLIEVRQFVGFRWVKY